MHTCCPTSTLFFEANSKSTSFLKKPPMWRNSLSKESTSSKLSLKEKGCIICLQQEVRPSYREDPFVIFLPHYFIPLLPLHCLSLELWKKPLHNDQLPIIQIPNKVEVSISCFPTLLPKISYSCLIWTKKSKQRKISHKGCSLHYFQNFTLLPSPTLKEIFVLKNSHYFPISFQTPTP